MARRRTHRVSISLPGERQQGRRSFLVKGLLGGALLAAGGAAWVATRSTRPAEHPGRLAVFSPEEAAVLLAVADRLVPPRDGFPSPRALGLAERMDAVAAQADPATQVELRRLVRLFESALSGLLLDGRPQLFTEASPERQDRRLRAWAQSRVALRRTGFRALKRLALASYYTSPATWRAVGYPGPPFDPAAGRPIPLGPPQVPVVRPPAAPTSPEVKRGD
jgi:Gluconate 2-dehydrogenase subunit 3